VPPAPTDAAVGFSSYVHEGDPPACVTVNVWPAAVMVPVRWLVEPFAPTEYVTVPLPVPAAPPSTTIHDSLLTAVHPHPSPAVTPNDAPVTPADPVDAPIGLIP
jgi:hypothetical protein